MGCDFALAGFGPFIFGAPGEDPLAKKMHNMSYEGWNALAYSKDHSRVRLLSNDSSFRVEGGHPRLSNGSYGPSLLVTTQQLLNCQEHELDRISFGDKFVH